MRDKAWDTFVTTGKVEDYLTYRYSEKKEHMADEKVRGESVYGADHRADGNGFADNAHGRL